MPPKKLKILVVSAEVAPFAKVGGLADVAGALPKALQALGHDVRVAMPAYQMVLDDPKVKHRSCIDEFAVPVGNHEIELGFVRQTALPSDPGTTGKVPVYLIGNHPHKERDVTCPGFFQRATDSSRIYMYAPEPYVLFARAIIGMLAHLRPSWQPDIIHCNDWHSGLIPAYLRTTDANNPATVQAATLFTIHNLAYQGDFPRNEWGSTGLPERLYNVNGLEFYGQWSFMKGGLFCSDRVNTVSENYAREIQTQEYGCGLDGLLRTLHYEGRMSGILNGIDYHVHDPATDPRLPAHFSVADPAGKALCKRALQEALGLPVDPNAILIGLISRLADQKGFDLIDQVMDRMLELPVQFVVLGQGDPHYDTRFRALQKERPTQVRACITFDTDLAQRIYAGSDLFLMPSRFEPCGLGQMFALRYGTVPIVRQTGGLADTVSDFDPVTNPEGNGFVFSDYRQEALLDAIQRAVAAVLNPEIKALLVDRALRSDFSWDRSAERYVALYRDAIAARSARPTL